MAPAPGMAGRGLGQEATSMYQRYWGLAQSPFQTPQAQQQLAATVPLREAQARVEFVVAQGWPLALVVGPPGSGKSALLAQCARQTLRQGLWVASLPCAGAREAELLALVAEALKVPEDNGHGQLTDGWLDLVRRLRELKLEGGRAVLLLDDLDEAQPDAAHLAARLVAMPDSACTLVVSTRPEALGRMPQRLLEHVWLRIDLAPLSRDETARYVQAALAAAGRPEVVFRDDALRRLHELSGGWPRKVDQLAELSLVAGASQQLSQIDADTIDAVHQELCVVL
jgi:type II secretory pathway predicted ATPase ExeA